MSLAELVGGTTIEVDVEDIIKVISFPHEWRLDANGDIIASAASKGHYAKVYLYQLILGLDNKTYVTFANGNKRDFTKSNLVIVL
jgi:hypothetical protein